MSEIHDHRVMFRPGTVLRSLLGNERPFAEKLPVIKNCMRPKDAAQLEQAHVYLSELSGLDLTCDQFAALMLAQELSSN